MAENETSLNFTPKGNPLEHLTEKQVNALNKRFNTSWEKPRKSLVEQYQTGYGMDAFTAAFTIALIEDAETMISNGIVNDAVDTITKQGQLILRGASSTITEALRTIKNTYEELSGSQRKQAGKKFRKKIFDGNTTRDFQKIIDTICEHLDVRESEWM
jgi:hypothetical protein